MKKVQIIATAAALAVGGYLALDSAANAFVEITLEDVGATMPGASVSFDQDTTGDEAERAACAALIAGSYPHNGCPTAQ